MLSDARIAAIQDRAHDLTDLLTERETLLIQRTRLVAFAWALWPDKDMAGEARFNATIDTILGGTEDGDG